MSDSPDRIFVDAKYREGDYQQWYFTGMPEDIEYVRADRYREAVKLLREAEKRMLPEWLSTTGEPQPSQLELMVNAFLAEEEQR